MLYEKLFSKLEKVRWSLNTDIAWDQIQPDRLTDLQKETIRSICKTEIGALFAAEAFIRDFYDDIDFSCFVSVWYYEEMKHCLVLKKYLSHLGIEISEDELQALRMTIPPSNRETILMIHFISEHRLALWYQGMADWLEEPVGKSIFTRIAEDEVRHGQGYFQYIQRDLERSPECLYPYLRSAMFMLNPKAPRDIHAVTITGTTDLLENPDYVTFLDEELTDDEGQESTRRRLYSLLSALSKREIRNYQDLSSFVKQLKHARLAQSDKQPMTQTG